MIRSISQTYRVVTLKLLIVPWYSPLLYRCNLRASSLVFVFAVVHSSSPFLFSYSSRSCSVVWSLEQQTIQTTTTSQTSQAGLHKPRSTTAIIAVVALWLTISGLWLLLVVSHRLLVITTLLRWWRAVGSLAITTLRTSAVWRGVLRRVVVVGRLGWLRGRCGIRRRLVVFVRHSEVWFRVGLR